jgi:hypothetical protein
MKPQDVIVMIKIHLWNQGRWKIVPLAESIYISKTETQQAIQRLKKSALFDSSLECIKKSCMEEFLIHGLKYCFPPEIGPTTRGLPTAHSSPYLADEIVSTGQDVFVWPHAKGKKRGLSVSPLYRTAADAALEDPRMYHYLALIDALRVGKAREQAIAKKELVKLIKMGNQYEA